MSDEEEKPEEKPYAVEIAKQGRANCKKCKQKCLQGKLRIAKLVYNPFGGGKMKSWHHVECLFELFLKQRPTTKRLEEPDDIEGFDLIDSDAQAEILQEIKTCKEFFHKKFGIKADKTPPKQKPPPKTKQKSPKQDKAFEKEEPASSKPVKTASEKASKDTLFKQFRRLIADITTNPGYLDKTECVKKQFTKGSDGNGFKDDIALWCRLLLPGVVKRVYNLQSKQLVKLFSRIFLTDQEEMLEDLEKGDVGETIQAFFEQSLKTKPVKRSNLTVRDVDEFLDTLSKLTKEDDQIEHFKTLLPKCTSNDLKTVIRLIKGDLRMGAGAKHVLEGIHPDAYEAYQASRDLDVVIEKCLGGGAKKGNNTVKAEISIMTPVLPMLAEACKSVEQAMKKCPNGMYSEIKYDGERVQVHKDGSDFKYFSRSLKPVLPHKIRHFQEHIPKAFPRGQDMILDSEILMIDTNTGKPLPFGTLGKHKKNEFKDASVCLFVFDCIYYNGESLIQKPLSYRKKILQENMKEITNHVVFSEMEEIHKPDDLAKMIAKVLKLGLEGLVLKDIKGIYEPGKRHWLKVKKDYLFGGAMADTADLLVLGAWYGTGKKGGMMSVFLMGCYNSQTRKFCTVTKVHTGHDDKRLEKLQKELDMVKISQDISKVPGWLSCTKSMVPDFVAKDPKKQPVWEITGAEFTQHDVHTADGISIRFPRVTRIRDDKDWETATNMEELQKLFTTSKESTDVTLLMKGIDEDTKQSTEKIKKQDKNVDENSVKDDDNNSETRKESPKKRKIVDNEDNEITKVDHKKRKKGSAKDSEIEEIKLQIKDPIPDYFQNIQTLIEDELKKEEHAEVMRLFVAYGGVILPSDKWEEATHILHYHNIIRQPMIKSTFGARHLAIEWVKDTIAKGVLQDFRPYTVQWDPEV